MALTRTTLSSAYTVGDNQLVVASATGFAADQYVRVDQEWFVVQKNYVSGTTIPVRSGQNGSKASAHVATAGVVTGSSLNDFKADGYGVKVQTPIAGRARYIESITATSSMTHPYPGSDHTVILNGTSVITLTVPVPTTDMDGDELTIVSNGAAAHVVTFTSTLNNAGAGYTSFTNNASGTLAIKVVACNGFWTVISGPAWTGTVTKVTGGLA